MRLSWRCDNDGVGDMRVNHGVNGPESAHPQLPGKRLRGIRWINNCRQLRLRIVCQNGNMLAPDEACARDGDLHLVMIGGHRANVTLVLQVQADLGRERLEIRAFLHAHPAYVIAPRVPLTWINSKDISRPVYNMMLRTICASRSRALRHRPPPLPPPAASEVTDRCGPARLACGSARRHRTGSARPWRW